MPANLDLTNGVCHLVLWYFSSHTSLIMSFCGGNLLPISIIAHCIGYEWGQGQQASHPVVLLLWPRISGIPHSFIHAGVEICLPWWLWWWVTEYVLHMTNWEKIPRSQKDVLWNRLLFLILSSHNRWIPCFNPNRTENINFAVITCGCVLARAFWGKCLVKLTSYVWEGRNISSCPFCSSIVWDMEGMGVVQNHLGPWDSCSTLRTAEQHSRQSPSGWEIKFWITWIVIIFQLCFWCKTNW